MKLIGINVPRGGGEPEIDVRLTADDLEHFRRYVETVKTSAAAQGVAPTPWEIETLARLADTQRDLFAEMDERDAKEENGGS